MIIISCSAIIVNAIQPLAGAFLPKRRLPIILLLGPIVAASASFIGLTTNYWLTLVILISSGVGIGVLHPEASMTVQNLSSKKAGLATSIFMSAGFFGFSTGSLVGGYWGQYLGLSYFWLLFLLGVFASLAIILTGLTKPEKQEVNQNISISGNLNFFIVLLIAMLMASNLAMIYRYLPIFFVRKFGVEVQAISGSIPFFIGLFGAIGSFLWGYISDKKGSGLLLLSVYLIGFSFLYFIINSSQIVYAIIPALFFGFSIGGSFPISVVLARKAKQFSMRLRMGLCIGGAWGTGEILVILSSKYIDCFPDQSLEPLITILHIPFILMFLIIILSSYIIIKEKQSN